ncbi:MAG: SsrA-binding protein SmpB [Gloeobacterales cyanobacterium]|jgi:SsrA-binding protein
MAKTEGTKLLADNRKARADFEILQTFQAGIELQGSEVKSIRAGRVNLRDAFARVRGGEVYLLNMHISPLAQSHGQVFGHDPTRDRKLLMHRAEIRKLLGSVDEKGLTLVPLKMYLKDGWIKVDLGIARGKKLYDKREDLKKKEAKREIERATKYQ